MTTSGPGAVSVGRIGGIRIFIHWSWLIIAVLLTVVFGSRLAESNPELDPGELWVLSLVASTVFFLSVLIHELAHAAAARTRDIEVKRITLYLFGGATEADAASRSPIDELIIAAAGPLTSVAIGVSLWVTSLALGPDREPLAGLIGYLALVNFVLALFNMTPGLPLDGGRVFRAIVWRITGDFWKATGWAATAGVAVGYVLIGLGVLSLWLGSIGGLWFAAIGWMISQSARATERQEELRRIFEQLKARDVMTSPVTTVGADCPLAEAVASHFLTENHTMFPVVDGDGLVGLLRLDAVRRLPGDQLASTTAGQLARREEAPLVVPPSAPMLEVIDAITMPSSRGCAFVVDNGELVGVISPADVVRRSAIGDLLQSVGTDSTRSS